MKYDPLIETVDGETLYGEIEVDMPITAANPVDMIRKLMDWCVENNVMPKSVYIGEPER